MITVKKSVLDNFIQRIVESRSDGNSYADMTGTMFDNMEEEPIKQANSGKNGPIALPLLIVLLLIL